LVKNKICRIIKLDNDIREGNVSRLSTNTTTTKVLCDQSNLLKLLYHEFDTFKANKVKGKGKFHPKTDHEGPEGD
jgi:hypothetical protein